MDFLNKEYFEIRKLIKNNDVKLIFHIYCLSVGFTYAKKDEGQVDYIDPKDFENNTFIYHFPRQGFTLNLQKVTFVFNETNEKFAVSAQNSSYDIEKKYFDSFNYLELLSEENLKTYNYLEENIFSKILLSNKNRKRILLNSVPINTQKTNNSINTSNFDFSKNITYNSSNNNINYDNEFINIKDRKNDFDFTKKGSNEFDKFNNFTGGNFDLGFNSSNSNKFYDFSQKQNLNSEKHFSKPDFFMDSKSGVSGNLVGEKSSIFTRGKLNNNNNPFCGMGNINYDPIGPMGFGDEISFPYDDFPFKNPELEYNNFMDQKDIFPKGNDLNSMNQLKNKNKKDNNGFNYIN